MTDDPSPVYAQLDYLADQLTKVEATMIDPVEFGELKGAVTALKRDVDMMSGKVDTLLEMANQGKGGLWMFRTMYVAAGGLIAYFLPHAFDRIGK